MLQIDVEFLRFFIFVQKTMAAFHTLKINSIKTLTNEASSIGFEIPSSLQDLFQYRSGQYINLKASIEGEEVRRSYSLCSAPSEGTLRGWNKTHPQKASFQPMQLKVFRSVTVLK